MDVRESVYVYSPHCKRGILEREEYTVHHNKYTNESALY